MFFKLNQGRLKKFQTALIHIAAIFLLYNLLYNQCEYLRRLLLRPSEFGIKP